MKKVLCISNGSQTTQRPVKVGDEYTVCKIVKGWEVWAEDADADFYMLVEMGSLCVYHSKLFIDLENESTNNKMQQPERMVCG